MQPWLRAEYLAVALALFPASTVRAQVDAQLGAMQPVHVTLAEALQRAEKNEPSFRAALAAQQTAQINKYLAKAALLPSATYHNQLLYTQPNGQSNRAGQIGAQPAPVFIANNAVREYASQAVVNETVGLQQLVQLDIASAEAARAGAELEVSRRGLVAAVVGLYYGVSTAQRKVELEIEALAEAQRFTDLTEKRESAREVAHADVVKAQLQLQVRQRDVSESKLMAEKNSLELGVLLFPDPRTPFMTDAAQAPAPLPSRDNVEQIAAKHNPELQSALAELAAAQAGVRSAKAAYLPDLGLNFTYGIDAPQFATYGPDHARNLGYSMSATVDLPVWDWFSTQKRIKQSEIQRDATEATVSAAQRRAIAEIEQTYSEAEAARDQLELLDQSVRTAAESLQLTNLRYSAGESTALEVVDAQDAQLLAQIGQAEGAVRYQTALASLDLLVGAL